MESEAERAPELQSELPGEQPGDVLGRYRLVERIGEGGMGTVWRAEQTEPVRRTVAVKVIKLGLDTREVVQRFEAERQALALMDHPDVAKVLDGGATESGRPYFVMDLVEGVPITQFCDDEGLNRRARLELFARTCDALHHAHSRGIVHRDVKPSNVLVARRDGVPTPRIIDFGIAKATHADLGPKTRVTEHAQVLGTLESMAPEQTGAGTADKAGIDARADLYSLGVLLYELLTGALPFDLKRAMESGYDEVLRTIREETPLPPSRRVTKLDVQRAGRPIRGDLDRVVMKALEKDRTRRYATASDLADDVRRFLDGRPVLAVPPSPWYRLRKLARRNRALVRASAVGLAALAVSAVVLARAAGQERARVADRSARAVEAIDAATLALGLAIPSPIGKDAEWTAARARLQRVADLAAEGPLDPNVRARANDLLARAEVASAERDVAARIEDVLITCASHPDLPSWQRMERELAGLITEHGMDVDRDEPLAVAAAIREHRFRERFTDALELWIATRGYMSGLGGPPATREMMQPWAEAMYAVDDDPLRTGIRRVIYEQQRPTPEDVDALVGDTDLGALSPRALTWLATTYSIAGAHEESDRILRDAMHRHPQDVMLFFDYGRGLAARGRWNEALRMYARATAIRPDAGGIWRMTGLALAELGELENAREALRAACAREPEYGPSWVDLGEVLLRMELADDALEAGVRAVDLMPDSDAAKSVVDRALDLGAGDG
ncbi:MAG: protein kinase [Planctomycetota bacterium]